MGLESTLRRDDVVVLAALVLLSLLAWLAILAGAGTGMDPAAMSAWWLPRAAAPASGSGWTPGYLLIAFFMWAAMMVAMMLPSASPMVLLYARVARQAESRGQSKRASACIAAFAGGYLALWILFSFVAVAFQWAAVVHWGLVITVIVLGSLCVVAVGLLLGNLFDDPQKMGFWVAIPMMILFTSMFLTDLKLAMPTFLSTLIDWLPTTAMTRVVRLSFSEGATMAQALPEFGVVLGFAVVLYGIVIWQVRRMDR